MHSILENDEKLNDPFEVSCCLSALIIEGRTPKAAVESKTSSDCSEASPKCLKPYSEGPHCPNHKMIYSKEGHKCGENRVLCIRYKNLRQHLFYLQSVSPSTVIEVSLGPDCLCGELRSQSTLVSTQPSKRDTVLEQWTINLAPKENQESSSQMSVLNMYQAVRSLLHFSQLTAWYASTNGTKPAHVIYRVASSEDATYIADDDFVTHNLPVVDVNKTVSIKVSMKALPRKEKIPAVFCLQHPASPLAEESDTSSFEKSHSNKKDYPRDYARPSHSAFDSNNNEDLLETDLPLKFCGVRKKISDAQERKRKKCVTLYKSPASIPLDKCSDCDILDGMPVDAAKMTTGDHAEFSRSKRTFPGKPRNSRGEDLEPSKADYKKCKPLTVAEFVKQQRNVQAFDEVSCNYFERKHSNSAADIVLGLGGLGDAKKKCDFRTKSMMRNEGIDSNSETGSGENKTAMDILDDRMQISCAISGKHHCKWECEEDTDFCGPGVNAEKPKRRRSISKTKVNDFSDDAAKLNGLDFEKILHGKFKEIDSESPPRMDPIEGSLERISKPNSSATRACDSANAVHEQPRVGESLLLDDLPEKSEFKGAESSRSEGEKSSADSAWVRKESFETFKRGCAMANEDVSSECDFDSDDELSDGPFNSSNPFLAAILRTTRKSKNTALNNEASEGERGGRDDKARRKPERSANVRKTLNGRVDFGGLAGSNSTKEISNPFKSFLNERSAANSEAKSKCTIKNLKPKNLQSMGKSSACSNLEPENGSGFFRCTRKEGSGSDQTFPPERVQKGNSPKSEENWESDRKLPKTILVPSADDKLRFRRSLDSAAQLVFHRCSGLPLTSSPAPVRRNNSSFSFDSSLNSVSAIKSALFEPVNSPSSEDENESEGSLKSPASPGAWSLTSKQINHHSLSPLPLLGSFEESVLNGRLEPVSTVQGFTAELGASGSFCPRHLYLPVTVFFYTLGDNDKVSAPYLGHINLGKKGYSVPRSGTIQVTLFNPLRTVVKMFVVVYDLSDMPANSHTFLRQRTLYVPASQKKSAYENRSQNHFELGDYHKYLRYLIHLRFVSGKTGRIYLHTDIRMVIFRKADEDTATALGKQSDGETYELRSLTHGPVNPKFSPRK